MRGRRLKRNAPGDEGYLEGKHIATSRERFGYDSTGRVGKGKSNAGIAQCARWHD